MNSNVVENDKTPHDKSKDALGNLAQLGEWLAIAAAIGVPLYPVALTILAVQIAITFAQDFATAWQAASIVPHSVVVGQAFRVLWINPAITVTYALIAMSGPYFGIKLNNAKYSSNRFLRALRQEDNRHIIRLNVALMQGYVLIGSIAAGRWIDALGFTISILLIDRLAQMDRDAYQHGVSFPVRLLRSLLGFYICLAIFNITSAELGMLRPPLSKVEMNKDSTTKVQGWLLGSSGAYWYVIADPGGDIVAIPDASTGPVTISRRADPVALRPMQSPPSWIPALLYGTFVGTCYGWFTFLTKLRQKEALLQLRLWNSEFAGFVIFLISTDIISNVVNRSKGLLDNVLLLGSGLIIYCSIYQFTYWRSFRNTLPEPVELKPQPQNTESDTQSKVA